MKIKSPVRIIVSFLFLLLITAISPAAQAGLFKKEQPNILFIIVDTLRSDHLGCYGYQDIKTPNIDNLAKRGTLFENVITSAPLTLPAHVSIFTSTFPQFNKVRDNGSYQLPEDSVTLADRLKEKQYKTAAFVSTVVLDKEFGLDKGFDLYDDKMVESPHKQLIKSMEGERPADLTTAVALEWLNKNKDEKFFLWVHYYDPHTVYNPPAPYNETYKDNLYDGEIAFVDKYIGELLTGLKNLGLEENTVIIFAGDHGEGLGQHMESQHAVFLYDTTLKVPLIFSYPKKIPKGKTIKEQVRLVDIMPTLLDLIRIKKNKDIQGRSLLRAIRGKGRLKAVPAYSESFYAKFHYNWSELQSWRTEQWKYIKSSEPELFNVKEDPLELKNLIDERQDVANKMDADLEAFFLRTTSDVEEKKVVVDQETREKLMSLGYVQGSIGSEDGLPAPREMIRILDGLDLAGRMANEGQVKEAMDIYTEILELDPDNIAANMHLATCYKSLDKYDEAIEYFRRAIALNPDEFQGHSDLGNVYKSMGRIDEAFAEFELALAIAPDDPDIINNIGWYYQQKQDYDKAMQEYKKALKIDNSIAPAHANMGIIYRESQQLDKAIQELEIAIKLDPKMAFAYSGLGACFALKGDLDKAIEYCEKSIELEPEAFEGYNNLAVCYEFKGEHSKALEVYKMGEKVAPWNKLVYLNIGNSYVNLDQLDKARAYYKKALDMDPNCIEARGMLERIDNLDSSSRLRLDSE